MKVEESSDVPEGSLNGVSGRARGGRRALEHAALQ